MAFHLWDKKANKNLALVRININETGKANKNKLVLKRKIIRKMHTDGSIRRKIKINAKA